jgi:transposase
MLPNDLPPWEAIYQQTQRWLTAGVFEAIVNDLRQLLRIATGRKAQPSGAIFDSCTLQSSPESRTGGLRRSETTQGQQSAYGRGSLGHLLALRVTPASEQDWEQVAALAAQVQAGRGQSVEMAFGDQGYTGEEPLEAAAEQGIRLEVVKLPKAKRGFVLLARRWVVERSFAWTARFRRLARDYERLPRPLVGLHFLAFAVLLLHRFIHLLVHCL